MRRHPDGLRLYHPASREAPRPVLAALREIDPRSALVWLKRGVWALGTIIPHVDRRAEAERALEQLQKAGKAMAKCPSRKVYRLAMEVQASKVALWRLKLQGFVMQRTFDCGDSELPGLTERWLREATWVRQHCYESEWNRLESELERDQDAEQRETEVLNLARLRDAWRMEFKRPVSTTVTTTIPRPAYDPNGIKVSA